MTEFVFHPLTADRWDDFVALFETDYICRGCWCVAPRLPARQRGSAAERKAFMAEVVANGPPPGLLGYAGDTAVGWLAIAPRAATPDWNSGRKCSAVESREDASDPGVWAATCFAVRRGWRGKGLAERLLREGVAYAKTRGAKRIEAAPMAHDDKRSPVGLFVGPKRIFDRASFTTVLERREGRPLMRLEVGA